MNFVDELKRILRLVRGIAPCTKRELVIAHLELLIEELEKADGV